MSERQTILIRTARPADVTAIYGLLLNSYQEMAYVMPPPLEFHAFAWILRTMESGRVYLAERGGQAVASVGLRQQTWEWNPTKPFLQDVWFYILPDARRGGTARGLMQAAKKLSEETKLPLFMGITTGTSPDLKERFYAMQGLQYLGGFFAYTPSSSGGERP